MLHLQSARPPFSPPHHFLKLLKSPSLPFEQDRADLEENKGPPDQTTVCFSQNSSSESVSAGRGQTWMDRASRPGQSEAQSLCGRQKRRGAQHSTAVGSKAMFVSLTDVALSIPNQPSKPPCLCPLPCTHSLSLPGNRGKR